ncbi:hypothetical protein BZG36_02723 [Bifiguratus adelaidae]|uniref:Cation-transporting P-type ATPase C-terminal domain-containing protein n=1 Tax=Bifiguratus adelaidae TaxID=1938954 RepID=A0A261XYM0_9FUNG|nr:hypothetical protein BZG36_02723 [Bifiguratus adelaidae]
MITGDNALTIIHIAKVSGMMPENSRVLMGGIDKVTKEFGWTDVDTGESCDVDHVLANRAFAEQPLELVVTGRGFDALVEMNKIHIRVCGRIGPDGKVNIVKLHMEYATTAMCGDGTNDCGALREAHVGLALSEAEASIVSPFSSSNRSVWSAVELIRQGRAALATSFSGYKFLILYSQILIMCKCFTLYYSLAFNQNTFLFMDAWIAWLLGDNYEIQTLAFFLIPQIIGAALAVNFGYLYRRLWYFNWALLFYCRPF